MNYGKSGSVDVTFHTNKIKHIVLELLVRW